MNHCRQTAPAETRLRGPYRRRRAAVCHSGQGSPHRDRERGGE